MMVPEAAGEARAYTLSSDMAEIATAVDAVLGPMGESDPTGLLPPADADDFRLCVTEALNNCIEHSYQGQPGHPIRLQLFADPSAVRVCLHDQGTPPPEGLLTDEGAAALGIGMPPAFPPPNAEGDMPGAMTPEALLALPDGGMGWMLIRSLADRITLEQDGGWNILSLEKAVER